MENTFILCWVCNSFQAPPAKAFLSCLATPQNVSFAIPQQRFQKENTSCTCEQFPLSISHEVAERNGDAKFFDCVRITLGRCFSAAF